MMDGFNDISVVRHTFQESLMYWEKTCANDQWRRCRQTQCHGDYPAFDVDGGCGHLARYQHLGGAMPAALAGHSLGEYTALVAAQSLDFATAIKLVSERALDAKCRATRRGRDGGDLGLSDEDVMDVCRFWRKTVAKWWKR